MSEDIENPNDVQDEEVQPEDEDTGGDQELTEETSPETEDAESTQEALAVEEKPKDETAEEPAPSPYSADLEAIGDVGDFVPPEPKPQPQAQIPWPPVYTQPQVSQQKTSEPDPDEPVSWRELQEIRRRDREEYEKKLQEDRQAQQRFMETVQRSRDIQVMIDRELDQYALTQPTNHDMRRLARDKIETELSTVGKARPWTDSDLRDAGKRALSQMYAQIGISAPRPKTQPAKHTTGKVPSGAPAQPTAKPPASEAGDGDWVNLLDPQATRAALERL